MNKLQFVTLMYLPAMRKLMILIFLVGSAFTASSQNETLPDYSGEWNGTARVPGGEIQISYQFTQHGLHLSGFAYSKSLNGRDSSKAIIQGTVSGQGIEFKATKFVYEVGLNCLSTTELTFEKEGTEEYLRGKWKGDFKLSTCPPGTGGKIEVVKIQKKSIEAIAMKSVEQQQVQQGDFEGNALVQELSEREYYALIIGIDQYADDKIKSLDNPVNDATSLSEIMNRYYTFEKENISLLTNPTRAEIIESFDALSMKIDEKDQLLIFYAGHGIWDERLNQGFWLPADARLSSKAQWLSNSTIRDYIGGIKSKHTLLITDACFSGSIFKERAVFTESKAMLEMYKLPSRKAMTSGALKTVPDKSVFITYLNKNLINNNRPLISAEELFREFKTAVINNSVNGQVPQYGPIGQVGDEGGDFIFLRRIE